MLEFIDKKITIYYASFVVLSIFLIGFISNNFISFVLGFNVFLAYIPLFLIWYLDSLLR